MNQNVGNPTHVTMVVDEERQHRGASAIAGNDVNRNGVSVIAAPDTDGGTHDGVKYTTAHSKLVGGKNLGCPDRDSIHSRAKPPLRQCLVVFRSKGGKRYRT